MIRLRRRQQPSEPDGAVLDLPGDRRIVQKVVFWYKSEDNGRKPRRLQQKATVTLEGKR